MLPQRRRISSVEHCSLSWQFKRSDAVERTWVIFCPLLHSHHRNPDVVPLLAAAAGAILLLRCCTQLRWISAVGGPQL